MRRLPVLDVAIALTVAVLGEIEVWVADVDGPRVVAASAAVLCALPLAWRRVAPLWVQFGCVGVLFVQFLLGVNPAGPSVPLLVIVVAGYSLGERGSGREAVIGGGGALAMIWAVVLSQSTVDATDLGFTALVTVAPIVLGRLLGSTRREAAAERERAVAEERSRIARELHDVVSHSISVMGIQAGAARRQLGPGHDEVRDVLLSVESVGREALTEMRHLLGILRAETGPLALAPQPGIGDLDELVARARAAGQPVELSLEVDGAPVGPGVSLAAYRIVQEALTNVRKHAGAAPATVCVRRRGGVLELEISDSGPGAGDDAAGFGLVGMRERVAIYGGSLDVESPAAGGHVVRARLPLEGVR
jgi:signal transduction histidine kinase